MKQELNELDRWIMAVASGSGKSRKVVAVKVPIYGKITICEDEECLLSHPPRHALERRSKD